MAGTDINIILTLTDKLSANLSSAQNKLQGFSNSVKSISHDLGRAGTNLTFLGGAGIAPFVLALNNVKDKTFAVNQELERTNNAFFQFQKTVATAALPTVKDFNDNLGRMVNAFNSLNPALREQVAHWVLVGSAMAIVAGTLAVIISKVGVLIGLIIKFAAVLISPGFLTFALILGTIAAEMETLPNQLRIVVDWMQKFLNAVASLFDKLSAIPKFGDQFKTWANQIRSASDDFGKSTEKIAQNLDKLKPSALTAKAVTSATSLLDKFKTKATDAGKAMADFGTVAQNTASSIGQAFQTHLGDTLFNAMTGRLNGLRGVFRAFGEDVLRILAQVAAKMLLTQTLGRLSGAGGILGGIGKAFSFFHGGGPIYAHSGLAPDEVPIIGQSGEGMLSKRGMATIGGSGNLRKLNNGQGMGGGQTIFQPVMVIKAWDAQDVYRNRKMLSQALGDEVKNNGRLRNTLRENA